MKVAPDLVFRTVPSKSRNKILVIYLIPLIDII
jgi:hypothetical protein